MNLLQIDYTKIRKPLLKETVRHQIANGVTEFSDIRTTAPTEDTILNFHKVVDVFYVNTPRDEVFRHYLHTNPYDSWNGGELVELAILIDKNNQTVYYPGDFYPGAEVGQVYYVHMNFFGLKKICVGQELVEINENSGIISFSYIEGGKSRGMQIMQFDTQGESTCKITHTSFFKSDSPFRDRFLYPYFHTLVVTRFHENMKSALK